MRVLLTGAVAAPPGFRGTFRSDDEARAVYSQAAGIARVLPLAIAVPADPDDLILLVQWALASRTPLVPRGSGSSMPGGAIGTGVVVDLSRWHHIGPVDVDGPCVRVGPGAICADVDRAARVHGLRFPVDPSSSPFCTIGGMTATNAAGPHTLAFSSMRGWVHAIDCVFADGSRAMVGRGAPPPALPILQQFLSAAAPPAVHEQFSGARHVGVRKDSSGYGVSAFAESGELIDLLVGSEGTLALFTEIEINLMPVAGATSSVLGAFGSLEHATLAAGLARGAGAVACELLDRTFIEIAGKGGLIPAGVEGSEAVLLAEVEADTAANATSLAQRVATGFRSVGATMVDLALDAATESRLWELRHAASPTLSRLDPSLRSMQFIEDGAVPPDRLPQYVRGVRAALERNATRGVIFGHAGDGHVHVNPLIDVSSAGWRERVTSLLNDVTGLIVSLGGTVTGEHGDGQLRTPLLERVWNRDAREAFATVKHTFDPDGILNPGVKIPVRGESGVAAIKYDPLLPALPARAAAALNTVERDRAYGRFRLELLDSNESS